MNDPSYEQVRLFDEDGNTVLVNSFIECEHYVNGTWNYYPGKDEITYLSWINGLLFFSFSFIIITPLNEEYLNKIEFITK